MNLLLAICAGIGLAAACGFRVFLPLLVTSLAVRFGHLHPSPGLDWVGSAPAVVMFSVATVVEIAAYYIPWLDHALDTIASPSAVVAGILVAAAAMPDVHPALRWSAAAIAGGAPAGLVQLGTVLTRSLSTATTAGLGNPIVSTLEWIFSLFLSLLALLLPLLAALLVLATVILILRRILRRRRPPRAPAPA